MSKLLFFSFKQWTYFFDYIFYLLGTFGNLFVTRSEDSDNNRNPYNYVPTKWVCILFIALYGTSTGMSLGEYPVPFFRDD